MDFMLILTTIGVVLLVAVIAFVGLLCLSVIVSAIGADHDHEHFDFEDLYPDKADKHHNK